MRMKERIAETVYYNVRLARTNETGVHTVSAPATNSVSMIYRARYGGILTSVEIGCYFSTEFLFFGRSVVMFTQKVGDERRRGVSAFLSM